MRKSTIFVVAVVGLAIFQAGDAFGQCRGGGGGGGGGASSAGGIGTASSSINPYAAMAMAYQQQAMNQAYQQQVMMQQQYMQQLAAQRAAARQQYSQKLSEGRARFLAEAKAADAKRMNQSRSYGGSSLLASSSISEIRPE